MNSNYNINLHFNQAITQRTGYAFKIGDKGCKFNIHCEDLDPTGMNPHIIFNHSDGTCVEGIPTTISARDYEYVIQGNEFGVCGKTVVDVKFYDGDPATQRISTASFMIEILPDTITPFDENAGPYADSLERAKEELDEATSDLSDMDALFAQTLQDYIDAFGNTAPINPRGAYDPNILYKPRDAVYYTSGGKTLTYLNNLECTGVDPTNTSNWQPIIDITGIPAIIDNCASTSTTDALSANQGRVLNENIEAIVDSGAKNLWDIEGWLNKNNQSYTKSGSVFTIPTSADLSSNPFVFSDTNISVTLSASVDFTASAFDIELLDTNNNVVGSLGAGTGTVTASGCKIRFNNPYIGQSVTLTNPMLRDARVIDPTYAPFAKTNLQLTNDKAERADIATIYVNGSTNTTGSTIPKGTLFYLNGSLCKAIMDIAVNATFTLNTNFVADTIAEEVKKWVLVATATGDGVKTFAQVIAEISASYNASEMYKYRIIDNDGKCFYPMGAYTFVHTDGADTGLTNLYFRIMDLSGNGFYEANNTLALTNYSTSVFTSGRTLKLYKIG